MDAEFYEKYANKIYAAIQGTPTRNRGADTVKQLIVAQLMQMMMEATASSLQTLESFVEPSEEPESE